MAKTHLTAAAVLRLKPAAVRREVPDAGAVGLRLVIQPSGAKSWALRFRRPGGRLAKLTLGPLDPTGNETPQQPVIGFPLTLVAARALAAEVHRQRAQDLDVVEQHLTAKRRRRTTLEERGANTFADAVRDYIERHKVKGQRPRRWREVARMLGLDFPLAGGEPTIVKHGLCDRWRSKPIAEINGDDLYHLIEEARHRGIPGLGRRNASASDSRGRKLAVALGSLFKWLRAHRRVSVDPMVGAHRPAPVAARDHVLNVKTDVRNADELRWFLAACDTIGGPSGAMGKLLLLTGARLKEIAYMTRGELNDDLSMLRLPGARTKNGRPHDIPLPPLARSILESLPKGVGPFVLSSNNGRTPFVNFSKIKKSFDAAMLAEAIKENGESATLTPWVFHDLRRSAATGMASIGVPPHVIEMILNHQSGFKASIAGTYNREAYEPEKRAALERWAVYIEGVVAGRKGNIVPLRGRT
jgi:integrase